MRAPHPTTDRPTRRSRHADGHSASSRHRTVRCSSRGPAVIAALLLLLLELAALTMPATRPRADTTGTNGAPVREDAGTTAAPAAAPSPSDASQTDAPARTARALWRILDYIAVDYGGAVRDGRVLDEGEYAEMVEFARTAAGMVEQLPPSPTREALASGTADLVAAIARRADPREVGDLARRLSRRILETWAVVLAPTRAPDPALGRRLYAERCAMCHGAQGHGDGPQAAGMEPPPIDFADPARADERSLYALFSTITDGIEGTAMPAYPDLSTQERWALAFHVGRFAYPEALAERGARLWRARESEMRRLIPDLEALVRSVPGALAREIGADDARAITAWLRHHPEALVPSAARTLAAAKERLERAMAAYREGDRRAAKKLALSAYLDHVEPVEPLLKTRTPALMRRLEAAMTAVRTAIDGHEAPGVLAERVRRAADLINEAAAALADRSGADATTSFVGAYTILLREGLEALLIVVAMIAFLSKAGRRELLPHVHAGWIAALLAGAATWIAATRLVEISGAGRELTEGIGGLVAAAVLVSVGIWMHGKSNAETWQRYIADTMQRALSRRSAWFLFGLSFLVVYREAFETILFYAALWGEGTRSAVAGGAGAAAATLALVAWLFLRFSMRLPIRQFFLFSSWLIAVLAVVLAGKGIAALQEAGWIGITPLSGLPRIDPVGFHPTAEGLVVQAATLAVLLIAFRRHGHARRPAPSASEAE